MKRLVRTLDALVESGVVALLVFAPLPSAARAPGPRPPSRRAWRRWQAFGSCACWWRARSSSAATRRSGGHPDGRRGGRAGAGPRTIGQRLRDHRECPTLRGVPGPTVRPGRLPVHPGAHPAPDVGDGGMRDGNGRARPREPRPGRHTDPVAAQVARAQPPDRDLLQPQPPGALLRDLPVHGARAGPAAGAARRSAADGTEPRCRGRAIAPPAGDGARDRRHSRDGVLPHAHALARGDGERARRRDDAPPAAGGQPEPEPAPRC